MGAIEPFTRKQSFSTTAVPHFALRARISLCASGVDLFRSQTALQEVRPAALFKAFVL